MWSYGGAVTAACHLTGSRWQGRWVKGQAGGDSVGRAEGACSVWESLGSMEGEAGWLIGY